VLARMLPDLPSVSSEYAPRRATDSRQQSTAPVGAAGNVKQCSRQPPPPCHGCVQANGVPESFGNDEEALRALGSGAVVVDRSHCGRIRLSGEDRLSFLHGQSTADMQALRPGQGTDTVWGLACFSCPAAMCECGMLAGARASVGSVCVWA
jgi:hypothetical protein